MHLACALCAFLIVQHEAETNYRLPWPEGKTYTCTQGNNDPRSHTGMNKFAFDFAMKIGTEVCAARGGKVTEVKENSNEGGPGREYVHKANIVVVTHADGTSAIYAHLKLDGALVEVGEEVRRGQVIALSGATGAATAPHLHFMVRDARGGPIQIGFEDVRENGGIAQGGRSYTSGNRTGAPPENAGRVAELSEDADLAFALGAFSIAYGLGDELIALGLPEETPQVAAARERKAEIERRFEEIIKTGRSFGGCPPSDIARRATADGWIIHAFSALGRKRS